MFMPTPIARMAIAVSVNAGDLRSIREPNVTSWTIRSHHVAIASRRAGFKPKVASGFSRTSRV